ncbi:MAG: hypothetical protein ACREV8_13085, partial [Gammaproteobacteria bacterium]
MAAAAAARRPGRRDRAGGPSELGQELVPVRPGLAGGELGPGDVGDDHLALQQHGQVRLGFPVPHPGVGQERGQVRG